MLRTQNYYRPDLWGEYGIQKTEDRIQNSGVQEFRSSGVQEFGSSRVREFESSGPRVDDWLNLECPPGEGNFIR